MPLAQEHFLPIISPRSSKQVAAGDFGKMHRGTFIDFQTVVNVMPGRSALTVVGRRIKQARQ